jgi:Tfp pilus assembly protein PilN
MRSKNSINLLQAELFPKEVLLTLRRVLLSWLSVILLMLVVAFTSQYHANQGAEQLTTLSKIKAKQEKVFADLGKKIEQNKPDTKTISQLATLKLVMANKQALYKELTNRKTTYVAGFAKAMTDLSTMHSENISLQKVIIDHDQLTFEGIARTPEAVPAWLTLFESSSVLSGKVFSHFSMTENDNDFTDFVVSTSTVELQK